MDNQTTTPLFPDIDQTDTNQVPSSHHQQTDQAQSVPQQQQQQQQQTESSQQISQQDEQQQTKNPSTMNSVATIGRYMQTFFKKIQTPEGFNVARELKK
jgi:adenylate cyclase